MYVIVGLGNTDKKYEHTRHNIGFDVIDALADKYNISVTDKKHKAWKAKLSSNYVTLRSLHLVLAKFSLK